MLNALGADGWGFIFYTGNNGLLSPAGRDSTKNSAGLTINGLNNDNAGLSKGATTGIVKNGSTSGDSTVNANILDYLFGTSGSYGAYDSSTGTGVYGKNYVGTANYLYQYNDTSGYYYFDSAKNAAFYDETDKRFYLYNYLVTATTSGGSTSDFLPYNYANVNQTNAASGTSTTITVPNTNYFFGMSTEIDFYLPDDTGSGGNQTVNENGYTDMVFKFSGDDDVWVYIDYGTANEQLLLDLGGIHDVLYGEINFSTGTVTTVNIPESSFTYTDSGGTEVTAKIVDYDENGIIYYNENYTEAVTTSFASTVEEGSHTLTIFYLERGASESNAAIYFNIAPVYTLKLAKVTAAASGSSTTKADSGVTFAVYTSSDFENSTAIDTVQADAATGVLTFEGLVPGTTYYLVETTAPAGYPLSYKYLTVYADSAGSVTVKVYSSSGELIETLDAVVDEDKYAGTVTDIATIIASGGDYEVFNLTTDPDKGDGVKELLLVGEAVTGTNTYLLENLSVFGASNSKYGTYLIATMTYANYLEYELPATGSTGIQPYLITGEALILIAGAGLILIAFYQAARLRRMRAAGNRGIKRKTGNRGYRREKFGDRKRNSGARDRPVGAGGTYNCSSLGESTCGANPVHDSFTRKRATGPGKRE